MNMQSNRAGLAAALLVAVLAGCGGGGGGGPTAVMQPVPPDTMPTQPTPDPAPAVVETMLVNDNDDAIDPTLAFRALELAPGPGAAFSTSTNADHGSPVIVFRRDNGPRAAELAPRDLDAMMKRAAHLWTRELTDGGTTIVDLLVGYPELDPGGPRHGGCEAATRERGRICPLSARWARSK